jgi:hypothetical protein
LIKIGQSAPNVTGYADVEVLSASEKRLKDLWVKAVATSDPAEVEPLLLEFRDVLHEHIDKLRAEAQKLRTG